MRFSLFIAAALFTFCSTLESGDNTRFYTVINKLTVDLLQVFEKAIPGWELDASLERNILYLADLRINATKYGGLNPDDSILRNYVKSVNEYLFVLQHEVKGFNPSNTVRENVISIVHERFSIFPGWTPMRKYENRTSSFIISAIQAVELPGFSIDKSIDQNIYDIMEASSKKIPCIDMTASMREIILKSVDISLYSVRYKGYSPKKTADDNTKALVDLAIQKRV